MGFTLAHRWNERAPPLLDPCLFLYTGLAGIGLLLWLALAVFLGDGIESWLCESRADAGFSWSHWRTVGC
jgi:hypothetical protein